MKLATLLTQYLYNNQRLDLPGIGTFLSDSSLLASLDNAKQRTAALEGISFESNPSLKDSPELIAFISSQTGKMKALAEADLDSHLEVAKQFLNIGKPFTFDGIGTLAKGKAGGFDFIPGTISSDIVKEYSNREAVKFTDKEVNQPKYESFLTTAKTKRNFNKPVVFLLILAGLGLTIWGGYTISKNAGSKKKDDAAIVKTDPLKEVVPEKKQDTANTITPVIDSVNTINNTPTTAVVTTTPGDHYKYILEIAQSQRAFKRYNQLKTNLWKVQMETKDSIQYKLFLLIPSIQSDTTRILDSLTVMTGKKVYIEHQN